MKLPNGVMVCFLAQILLEILYGKLGEAALGGEESRPEDVSQVKGHS